MRLSKLLEQVEYVLLKGSVDTEVKDVIYDSRKAKAGSAFVCMIGAVSDGHKYIKSAIDMGCRVLVVQKQINELEEEARLAIREADDITVIYTSNNRKTLSFMAQAFYDYPAKKLTTIGITGTKGKTTTSFMIRMIMEESGHKTGVIGTTGVYIGDEHIEIHNTTPESLDVQYFMNRMVEAGMEVCVMEVSSQALKLDRTAGVEFDYGVYTNLSPDHIGEGEHADYEEYKTCKSMLFQQSKHSVINVDDKESQVMIEAAKGDIHTYGFSERADIRGGAISYVCEGSLIGISFDTTGDVAETFLVNTPGRFSAYNAMAAIAVTNLCRAKISAIKDALSHTFVRGRVESVEISGRFTLLIDYAHNAMSMESILTTMREYKPNRLVSLFGCGGNRSKLRRYEMGETSGNLADLSVITADNSRFENVLDIIEDIKIGMHKTKGQYVVIPDRKEAIRYCILNAQDGDIILLLGKGHEDYQEIEGVRHPFDERVIIQEIMDSLTPEELKKVKGSEA